ncbi:MAG TPA: hypothetical protein VID28_06475 [Methylomirabilota bacterium]|jgi:hypothetical protein
MNVVPLCKKIAVTGIAALSLTTPVFAQETRVDRRQDRQEERIDRGVESGALTPRETRRLEHGQQHVENLETRAQADGKITAREKGRLEHAQDVQSKRIYRQKHDRQTR